LNGTRTCEEIMVISVKFSRLEKVDDYLTCHLTLKLRRPVTKKMRHHRWVNLKVTLAKGLIGGGFERETHLTSHQKMQSRQMIRHWMVLR